MEEGTPRGSAKSSDSQPHWRGSWGHVTLPTEREDTSSALQWPDGDTQDKRLGQPGQRPPDLSPLGLILPSGFDLAPSRLQVILKKAQMDGEVTINQGAISTPTHRSRFRADWSKERSAGGVGCQEHAPHQSVTRVLARTASDPGTQKAGPQDAVRRDKCDAGE